MISTVRSRSGSIAVLLSAALFVACGGGGGGSTAPTNPPSPPPPPPPPVVMSAISGQSMLGPISNADVTVSGTDGVLTIGTTGADGRFGPLSYPGDYTGPLRISVSGNPLSTWKCDFAPGCSLGDAIYPFGQSIPFDAEVEAVLPTSADGQFVPVSLLSNLLSERVDILGDLSATQIDAASADIATAIRATIPGLLNMSTTSIPDNFYTVELFDLDNLPGATGANDSLAALLTLVNSALVGLANPTESTGQFVDRLSAEIAGQPDLPVSQNEPHGASVETVLTAVHAQLQAINSAGGNTLAALDLLLTPDSTSSFIDPILADLAALPKLQLPLSQTAIAIDDSTLQAPVVREYPVTTSTGSILQLTDFDVDILSIQGADWVSASAVIIQDEPGIRLDFDNAAIATLPNERFEARIRTFSTAGDFASHELTVELIVSLNGAIHISAGPNIQAFERDTVTLTGSTDDPDDVQAIIWSQINGEDAVIIDADTLTPQIELPSLTVDKTLIFRFDVSFASGQNRVDFADIEVAAYADFSELSLADSALQSCVNSLQMSQNLEDAGDVTSLSCSGVSNIDEIVAFPNLTSIDLAGNNLGSLDQLIGMNQIVFLDISGNPEFLCAQVDQLAARLEEGTELLTDDLCIGSLNIDLSSAGFDAAIDTTREQIYVSIPDRAQIAVVSLQDLRVVDRISLSGSPLGIDLSIDGEHLFAALNGSNSVAIVDLDQRSVETVNLGNTTGHASTYDVVEGEPGRLFVSASPGSSGFAYIAQIVLGPINVPSTVAGNTIIRATPNLARTPDQQFVYVGSGFSPNSLYKLSLSDATAPIILEDNHGSVSGTNNLSVNETGTRIALRSGQVLRTGSFIEEGRVSAGVSVSSTLTDTLFVTPLNGLVEAFNFTTLAQSDSVQTMCDSGATSRLLAFDGDESFVFLQNDMACLYTTLSRTNAQDPLAALRFTDLAFEECVISTATAMGYSQPAEFSTLDCSSNTKTILSIEGIDRFTNLNSLDVSGSGLIDLAELAGMNSIQSITASNASLSDVSALMSLPALSTADLTENPSVQCMDYDQLVATGVSVQADTCTDSVRIELGGIGHDLEVDSVNDRAFVSVPSLNRISELDLVNGTISGNFSLPSQPRGIDFSDDMVTMYAALNSVGDIAALNTNNGNVEVIDISVELDDDRTWDVAEVSPDRILASTNPGSNGFGYIVEIRRDLANAATRVASNQIIRAAPVIEVSGDRNSVYVGSGFSPNSLYKLDATQATLPVVLEDDHGEVSGTSSLTLSPDGSRIYLRFGQVLDTDTFNQVAQFPPGLSVLNDDGSRLFVGDEQADAAFVYDTTTVGIVALKHWGCDILNLEVIRLLGDGVIALGDDLVCYSQIVNYP